MTHLKTLATLAAASLLLAGCGSSPEEDVHDIPRETQPWENVDLSGMDTAALLSHLKVIAAAGQAAAAEGAYIEFHHLEVALTPTLAALAAKNADNAAAMQTIEGIKSLAIKLHIAGHDGNVAQGSKYLEGIAKLTSQLTTQLS